MTPEQKIEFIEGQVIVHSPARNRDLDVTLNMAKLLHTFVGLHKLGTVKLEKCLCVFPRNDYEPDIVYFEPAKVKTLQGSMMQFPVPDLVVEVLSESTAARDRGVKFEDFAANDVAEYWIVDADANVVEQYVLEQKIYDLRSKSSSGRLRSEIIAGLEIDIEAFFDDEKNLLALRQMMQT